MKLQGQMLKLAEALEKQGHHITEIYNAAGFLRVLVDGEEKSLWQMIYLSKRR